MSERSDDILMDNLTVVVDAFPMRMLSSQDTATDLSLQVSFESWLIENQGV